MVMIDTKQVQAMLERACKDAGGQAVLADLFNVSPQYVSDVLQGHRNPGKAILDGLGLEKIIRYRKPNP